MLGFSDIKQTQNDNPIIKVVGIGGGGGNAINRMVTMMDTQSVEFIAANTDLQDLRNSEATYKLQLGINCTKGLGAGAKPQVGREAALENSDLVRDFVSSADMVFITAGMGGGTGTGGAPVVAQIARELEALTVGVVTMPFQFEGKQRRKNAEKGIQELKDHVDTLIVIPNDNLLGLVSKRTSMVESFNLADDVLRQAIQGISDLITNEGIINLDFADVRTVMQNGGKAVMGVGVATGDNRAIVAAEKAIHSPLLSDCKITGSQGILVNMVGGNTLTMHEVNEAACFIQEQAHEDATIIWGASIHPEQEDQFQITVIATGFGKEKALTQEESNLQQDALLNENRQSVFMTSNNPSSESSLNSSNPSFTRESQLVSSQTEGEEQEVNDRNHNLEEKQAFQEVNQPAEERSKEISAEEQASQEEIKTTDEIEISEEKQISQEEIRAADHDIAENQKVIVTPLSEILNVASVEESISTLDETDPLEKENEIISRNVALKSQNLGNSPFSSSQMKEDSENITDSSSRPLTLKTLEEVAVESLEKLENTTEPSFIEEAERTVAAASTEVAVETSPRYPDWAWRKRHRRDFTSDLDIPTFIRRRAKKLGQDFR